MVNYRTFKPSICEPVKYVHKRPSKRSTSVLTEPAEPEPGINYVENFQQGSLRFKISRLKITTPQGFLRFKIPQLKISPIELLGNLKPTRSQAWNHNC